MVYQSEVQYMYTCAQWLTTRPWACKFSRASLFLFTHILNWCYLLLSVERLAAVLWPLWAKIVFGVQRNIIFIAIIVC